MEVSWKSRGNYLKKKMCKHPDKNGFISFPIIYRYQLCCVMILYPCLGNEIILGRIRSTIVVCIHVHMSVYIRWSVCIIRTGTVVRSQLISFNASIHTSLIDMCSLRGINCLSLFFCSSHTHDSTGRGKCRRVD